MTTLCLTRSWTALALLLMAACDEPAAPADTAPETCEAPMVEIYTSPGCGPEVKRSTGL